MLDFYVKFEHSGKTVISPVIDIQKSIVPVQSPSNIVTGNKEVGISIMCLFLVMVPTEEEGLTKAIFIPYESCEIISLETEVPEYENCTFLDVLDLQDYDKLSNHTNNEDNLI